MDKNSKKIFVNQDITDIQEMVKCAISGKNSLFKECFDRVLRRKSMGLLKREKSRIAKMHFDEACVSNPQITLKEDDQKQRGMMYNKLCIIDGKLFERERDHMPDWMQEATPDCIEIEPIREKDAIDLSNRYHSVEFTAA